MGFRLPPVREIVVQASRVAVLTIALGMNANAQPAQPGEEIARRNCSQCHSLAANGASPNPAALPLRDLRELGDIEVLITALRQGLLMRHPAMPELRLSPREIEQLGVYLRDLQTKKDVRLRRLDQNPRRDG